ncbi:cytochrome c3 family protein [Shewanella intestini]|uniref:Outer membrane cytochrome MtrC/MtrF-like domain-containing protein n=1 Tax=Shewanella intestini TaxID=2017544 RepID=A0ABS5I0K5_9GAMM|nr:MULTISPECIES: cytochrome c3 family protein [Shewanella]MBR9727556.1 hypothetical protein [Shewanella intestini]MRG35294.1 hypothetical protein [Shewanella sp. XMDDZSB0408]
MMGFNKCKIAFVVAAAMAMGGCAEDGKDGAPGPGPSVSESEVTNIHFINHVVEEGKVTLEFNITNEDGIEITGLEDASVNLAAKTENGIQRSRDGSVGGSATAGGDNATEGATLTMLDNGNYEFVAPMAAVQAGTEGIIRLQVGGGDIAKSPYTIVSKPEMTHTTTTETCYSCHVDYATSDIRHSGYVAVNAEGDVDFVGGCMVCHNNVARDVAEDGSSLDTGGYAKATMQQLGHINHQKFEKDFTPTNCYTCHAEPVMNTSITGNGCTDCHAPESTQLNNYYADTASFDVRELHANSASLTERKQIRETYSTQTSAPYYTTDYTYGDNNSEVGGYCVDLKLFDNSGDVPVQVNIADLEAADKIAYTGAYIDGYDLETGSILARLSDRYDSNAGHLDRPDGTRSLCYTYLAFGDQTNFDHLSGSTRLTIKDSAWMDSDNEYGVAFTSFADPVEITISLDPSVPHTLTDIEDSFARRHIIDAAACTTCHNNGTNYHKSGSYTDGGRDCVACHNNGYDRNAAGSAPGFGPMIHSMHWGLGNALSGAKKDDDGNNVANSADSLNADNCVSCHSNGIDMDLIPNRYMLSKSYNGGAAGVMTSPVTANCMACHDSDAAISHMEQNGGELNVVKGDGWYNVPTAESCSTCHAEGKSFGIDKFHNFER